MITYETRIREVSVVPVRLELACATDRCDGFMIFTGEAFTQIDTSYKHECSSCHSHEWHLKSYPRVEFREAKRG